MSVCGLLRFVRREEPDTYVINAGLAMNIEIINFPTLLSIHLQKSKVKIAHFRYKKKVAAGNEEIPFLIDV